MDPSVDVQEDLIQVPLVARPRRPAAQAVGISLTELERPFSHRLVREGDAATGHQLFDIAKAQGEAKIQPNAVTDDLGGKAMTMIVRDGAHPWSMPHELSDYILRRLS